MRMGPAALLVVLCSSCNVAPIRDGVETSLSMSGLATHGRVDRSTRWTLPETSRVIVVADYDEREREQVASLDAAFAGLARIFPQAERDPRPIGRNALNERLRADPVELCIHLVLLRSRGVIDYGVSLLDGRSGQTIDRARISLNPPFLRSRASRASVQRAFEEYASQLVAVQ